MDIKTFIFLDCETSGLPHKDGNTTKITELCLTAVHTDYIWLGTIPRMQSKINLCFNPKKKIDPVAARISQLSNDLLQHQPEFDSKTVNIIKDFLSLQCQPVCFVAHNGDKFDYPILLAELHNTGNKLAEDILCIDSLQAFKKMYYQDVKRHALKKACTRSKVVSKRSIKADDLENSSCLKKFVEETHNSDETTSRRDKAVAFHSLESVEEESQEFNSVDLHNSGCLTKLKFSSEEVQIIDLTMEDDVKENIVNNNEVNTQNSENNIVKQQFCFRQVSYPSFKLGTIYKLLTSKQPSDDAHHAEYDVHMLMECAAVLNERFVNWANLNAKRFYDIPMMAP